MGMLDGTTLGRRNLWLTGAAAGLSLIPNKLNQLASLNLLEKMRNAATANRLTDERQWEKSQHHSA
jgi:hypothetical protein